MSPVLIKHQAREWAGPLIILLEPGWAEGQICPDEIWLIWGAFVRIPEVGSGFWPICPDV
jgi:hypothetical protein